MATDEFDAELSGVEEAAFLHPVVRARAFGRRAGYALLLVAVAAAIAVAVISWGGSQHAQYQARLQDGVSWAEENSTQLRCPGAFWGVAIDGRNAMGGRCAYSCKYATEIEHDLKSVYSMLQNSSLPQDKLTLKHFDTIRGVLGQGKRWHNRFKSPISQEIAMCHSKAFSPDQAAKVMANITTVSRTYDPIYHVHFPVAINNLFEVYNQRVHKADTGDERLEALASLLRNLAFLHPLHDRNGRSRMLLLQLELRRLQLGCGTMMFNNNKNIYFDELETFKEKIKEGMQVYQEAQAGGFKSNPWQQTATLFRHFSRFPLPKNATTLESCWRRYCKPQPNPKLANLERMEFGAAGLVQDLKRRLRAWAKHHPPHFKHPFAGCAGTSPF